METIVGIDLGTTNSVVAAIQEGRPRVLTTPEGERLLPSVVGLSPEGDLLVGHPARNQYVLYPERTIKSVKRVMGQDISLPLGDKRYTPPQISAFILERLKAIGASALGQDVRRAVITVPAYFTDGQRQATREAGELAGLEVVRIINEPTAAALAYGLERGGSQRVLVYDLGGGTFDVSVVEVSEGVVEVVATAGNNHLGGDDFDARLVDFLCRRFADRHGVDLRQDRRALARVTRAAEEAKIRLSTRPFTRVSEPFIVERNGQPLNLDEEISRAEFEKMIADLLEETVALVKRALQDAQLKPVDLDMVLLVGGSTRIPAVVELVKTHLGQLPHGEINPDECVALGAAVQAGIVAGEPLDMVFVDVAAHSLGIKVLGTQFGIIHPDVMSVIIPRNTAIPCSRAEVFTTVEDNQQAVTIKVYQGESMIASKNTLLGEFTLHGIPPMPAGKPQIVVQFDYDIDGIIHVSATERSTGKAREITIARGVGRARDQAAAAVDTGVPGSRSVSAETEPGREPGRDAGGGPGAGAAGGAGGGPGAGAAGEAGGAPAAEAGGDALESGARDRPPEGDRPAGPQVRKRRAVLRRARRLARELDQEQAAALLGLITAIERAEKRGDEGEADRLTGDLWDLLYEKMG